MSFVIDSSTTLSWYFEDERNKASAALLDRTVDEGAVVPSLWKLEVANGLQMALRRGRIDAAYRAASLASLSRLPITIDPETDQHAWRETVDLADRLQLTVYDAAYLELAQRQQLPLASLDKALLQAARRLKLPVLGGS